MFASRLLHRKQAVEAALARTWSWKAAPISDNVNQSVAGRIGAAT